jgi:hypothetical protein
MIRLFPSSNQKAEIFADSTNPLAEIYNILRKANLEVAITGRINNICRVHERGFIVKYDQRVQSAFTIFYAFEHEYTPTTKTIAQNIYREQYAKATNILVRAGFSVLNKESSLFVSRPSKI